MSIVKLFYDKEMFKDAGITQLPETWSEFLAAQKKLKGCRRRTVFISKFQTGGQSVQLVRTFTDLSGGGGPFAGAGCQLAAVRLKRTKSCGAIDLDTVDLTKSPFADVFPMLKEWSQYWAEGYNAIDDTTAKQMFIRQETAMMLGFPSTVEDMKQMGTTFDYGVFTFPYLTKADNEYACEQSYEMGANVTEVYCIPSNVEGDQLLAAMAFPHVPWFSSGNGHGCRPVVPDAYGRRSGDGFSGWMGA